MADMTAIGTTGNKRNMSDMIERRGSTHMTDMRKMNDFCDMVKLIYVEMLSLLGLSTIPLAKKT